MSMNRSIPMPFFQAEGDGQFQRHVLDGWFHIMDLAKPVIAQVHGYCLAGGSELAAACDLVYVGEGAKIGYPPVRSMGLPDANFFAVLMPMRASLRIMLTGDTLTGAEAVKNGWANRCFPDAELDANVLDIASKVAQLPSDLTQFTKRSVQRALEAKGARTYLRYGTDLQALSFHTPSSRLAMKQFAGKGSHRKAFSARDAKFGDNRAAKEENKEEVERVLKSRTGVLAKL